MASVLNRATKQFIRSANTPDYPEIDWIKNPDMSAVVGFESKYWKIDGDTVSLMSEAERNAVDAAEAAAATQAAIDAEKARLQGDRMVKAMVATVVQLVNPLRSELSLDPLSNEDVAAVVSTALEAS